MNVGLTGSLSATHDCKETRDSVYISVLCDNIYEHSEMLHCVFLSLFYIWRLVYALVCFPSSVPSSSHSVALCSSRSVRHIVFIRPSWHVQ